MNKQKNAFTLVELIVVITILAILGTIAFLTFQGYSASARDSKRISDMNTIKTSLELFGLNSGKFPDPVNPVMITYSSGTINNLNLRQQGIFGQQNVTNVSSAGKLDRLPKDPLTELEYTYSTTLDKKEFELGTILENDDIAFSPVNITNAATKKVVSAFIKGNYNGKILKTSSGSTSYIFAVPSIINSDATLTDINQLISPINKLAYNGFANLPATYDGPTFEVNGAPDKKFVNPNEILVFEGDTGNLILPDNSTPRIQLLEAIKDAYSGTDLAGEGDIKNIVNLDISDPANPTPLEEYLAGLIVNNELGGDLKLVPVTIDGGTGTVDEGTGTVDEGETLVCEDMTQDNIDVLNSLIDVSDWDEDDWCSLDTLNLGESELTSIPNEIGYLTNLQYLYLYDNQLSSLPSTMSNLTNLIELDLGTNSFTTFPSVLLNINSLENLRIYENQITSIPSNINELSNLVYLDIGANNFSSFPTSVTTLININKLGLSYNGFTSLPQELSNLTNLYKLELEGNDDLGNLSYNFDNRINSYGDIILDGKKYTISSEGDGNPINIEISDLLVCNELTQEVANILNNTFGFIDDLEYSKEERCNLENFYLHQGGESCYDKTQVTTLPPEIKYLTNLKTFDFSCNSLTSLPPEIKYLTNLTELNLNNNENLTSLPPEIGYLTNLEILSAGNNSIESIPTEIGNLTKLTELNLHRNTGLQSIPTTIGNLTELTKLDLDGEFDRQGLLTTIPSEIGYLTKLTELGLGNNQLTSIPSEIGNLTQLTDLRIYYNNLDSLPTTIGSLNKLTNLNLNGNSLDSLPEQIGNLNITELSLDDNDLTTLPTGISNLSDTLTILGIGNNNFSHMPSIIGTLTNLTKIDAENNSLETIPDTIENLINLQYLWLGGNTLLGNINYNFYASSSTSKTQNDVISTTGVNLHDKGITITTGGGIININVYSL